MYRKTTSDDVMCKTGMCSGDLCKVCCQISCEVSKCHGHSPRKKGLQVVPEELSFWDVLKGFPGQAWTLVTRTSSGPNESRDFSS